MANHTRDTPHPGSTLDAPDDGALMPRSRTGFEGVEPGQSRTVRLVAIAGKRQAIGFRGDVMGKV